MGSAVEGLTGSRIEPPPDGSGSALELVAAAATAAKRISNVVRRERWCERKAGTEGGCERARPGACALVCVHVKVRMFVSDCACVGTHVGWGWGWGWGTGAFAS